MDNSLWSGIEEDQVFPFGLITVDMTGSSNLEEPSYLQSLTKGNLHDFIKAIVELRGGRIIGGWAGDGGIIGRPIKIPKDDYDAVAALGILLSRAIVAFNADPIGGNLLSSQIQIRVACHIGNIIYSNKPGRLHGSSINFVAKYERQLSGSEQVALTDDLWNNLVNQNLKLLFRKKQIQLKIGNKEPQPHIVYLYPNLEDTSNEVPFCSASTGFQDQYKQSVQVESIREEDRSDLWYIFIRTKNPKECKQKVKSYVENKINSQGILDKVTVWSLLGEAEFIIKLRALQDVANSLEQDLRVQLFGLLEEADIALYMVNIARELVRNNLNNASDYSPGKLKERKPLSLEETRSIKTFIKIYYDKEGGFQDGTINSIHNVIRNFTDIIESYSYSLVDNFYRKHIMIEAHLPCGRLSRLDQFSIELEAVSSPNFNKETYLAYNVLSLSGNSDS